MSEQDPLLHSLKRLHAQVQLLRDVVLFLCANTIPRAGQDDARMEGRAMTDKPQKRKRDQCFRHRRRQPGNPDTYARRRVRQKLNRLVLPDTRQARNRRD